MVKAIALLSGGLDSTLAVRLMMEQNIEILALNFVTPFCTCTKKGCLNQAKRIADKFNIHLKSIALKEEYIGLIRKPKHGYGKNMNPCIDCRIFMFSKAREYMHEYNASFVFTGEVLNERPMSQHRRAMEIIEKESGLQGKVLRPLSAKYMAITTPEIEGIVDRSKLMDIKGRSRKPQIILAREKGINDYPCPAGGCRLTDPNYAKRLRDAFQYQEDTLQDIVLLRYGRHFRLPIGAKTIVGRNEQENNTLVQIADNDDVIIEVVNYPGPIALLRKCKERQSVEMAAGLCITFSDYKNTDPTEVMAGSKQILSTRISRELLSACAIN